MIVMCSMCHQGYCCRSHSQTDECPRRVYFHVVFPRFLCLRCYFPVIQLPLWSVGQRFLLNESLQTSLKQSEKIRPHAVRPQRNDPLTRDTFIGLNKRELSQSVKLQSCLANETLAKQTDCMLFYSHYLCILYSVRLVDV